MLQERNETFCIISRRKLNVSPLLIPIIFQESFDHPQGPLRLIHRHRMARIPNEDKFEVTVSFHVSG